MLLAQLTAGAQALVALTGAWNVPGRSSLAEIRVIQSAAHASYAAGPFTGHVMVSLEPATMPGGHLSPGAWGEGFIDRRHPHTWVHELIATATNPVRLPVMRWSLSAGKGFAPFGTDDPMSRPAVAFPVNHHWSQILERAVIIGAVAAGPVMIEGGVFNGDEPEYPAQWPDLSRFGDSWSLRGSLMLAGVELQLSRARVRSPEHRPGAGLEHLMWNGSARLERVTRSGGVYALAEAAHTDEEGAFEFASMLAEAQLARGRWRHWLRYERTERPEEPRTFGDPYRGTRPHFENANLGTTRWSVVTAGSARRLSRGPRPLELDVFAEASRASVTAVTGLFDPESFYGGNVLWSLNVGVRIGAGARVYRMGRYGIATTRTPDGHEH